MQTDIFRLTFYPRVCLVRDVRLFRAFHARNTMWKRTIFDLKSDTVKKFKLGVFPWIEIDGNQKKQTFEYHNTRSGCSDLPKCLEAEMFFASITCQLDNKKNSKKQDSFKRNYGRRSIQFCRYKITNTEKNVKILLGT